jgi:hypothetical protein
MTEPTQGPWKAVQCGGAKGGHYFEIRGPNGEAIATLFPQAGNGGVGQDEARANAEWIASNGPPERRY